MTERFAVSWVIGCAVIMVLCVFFGFESIPRMLDYSEVAAVFIGIAFPAITLAPIIWISFC